MTIFMGSDHAGFELKNEIKKMLEGLGQEVFDKGPSVLDESDDYPDFIAPVAREVSKNPKTTKGIVLGGSGQGAGAGDGDPRPRQEAIELRGGGSASHRLARRQPGHTRFRRRHRKCHRRCRVASRSSPSSGAQRSVLGLVQNTPPQADLSDSA